MLIVPRSCSIHLLLCCLEEAMKRNGDIRLAALDPGVKAAFAKAEVDSLFQSFENVSEAVESFHRPQLDFIQLENAASDNQDKSQMDAA
jgi:hypothetical protein